MPNPRRHHNNKGYRQIRDGKTYEQVKVIARRLHLNQQRRLLTLPRPKAPHRKTKLNQRPLTTMPKVPIIDFNRSYTFSNYFDLPYEPEDILAEFGYSFERSHIDFPRTAKELTRLSALKEQIEDSRPLISLTSEMARREFLIAPILLEVARSAHAKLSSEYPLVVTDQLKGSLDYFLRSEGQLLIVEAKKADLDRGFTQLAVELIALEQWATSDSPILQGVVSNGTTWIFGQLERNKKQITQDIEVYTIPANLEDLLRILVEILEG